MPIANEDDDVKQVVRALTKAAQEHGTPNSFAPSELAGCGCRLSALRVGQLASRCSRSIYEQLAVAGLNVHYTARRFQVALTSAEQLAIVKTR